jgi:beta-glucosidase
MRVLYPFGHGLSYTTFEYSNFVIDKKQATDQDTISVTLDVTNTGKIAGKEVVQLYVKDNTQSAIRPEKELKGFEAVRLNPGETKKVAMTLNKRSFAWYNTDIHDWYVAFGEYTILVGKSSRDIVFEEKILVEGTNKLPFVVDKDTMLGELMQNPKTADYTNTHIWSELKVFQAEMEGSEMEEMMKAVMNNLPLRSLRSFASVTNEQINNWVEELNRL